MDILTTLLLLATAATVLRLLPIAPRGEDSGVLNELVARRGLSLYGPRAARGRIRQIQIDVCDCQPGPFLSIELRGAQPDRLKLLGRSDAGHPVLRALDADIQQRVRAALEIDAILSSGTWMLQIWETQHASAADRLLGLVLDAAEALASLPLERIDQAIVAFDPDPNVRRTQIASAIAHQRAPIEWLIRVSWSDVPEVAILAAAAAGEAGHERLLTLLDEPYVAERAALALSHLAPGDEQPRVEAMLLSSAEAGDIAAIDALGRYGSVEALPTLHGLAEHALGLSDIARHAKAAIEAIYTRAGGPGLLSLADTTGGELSLP